jgi:molybdopterin-biosynthesis enzyme MoeA-like protein
VYDPDRPDNIHRLNMGVFPMGATIIPNPYNKIAGFSCVAQGGGTVAASGRPKQGTAPLGGSDSHEVQERGGTVHFVPGFPVMAWPMMAWVLDTHYAAHFNREAWVEQSVVVFGAMEAALTPLMESLEQEHPGIKVFSLPSVDHPVHGRHIELGVKGAPEAVAPAYAAMLKGLEGFNAKLGPEMVRK